MAEMFNHKFGDQIGALEWAQTYGNSTDLANGRHSDAYVMHIGWQTC